MNELVNLLNSKIDLYRNIEEENELGEITQKKSFIKNIWANIIPTNGTEKNNKGNSVYSETTFKIIVRSKAIENLSNDMYFIFKEQRYDVVFFMPNYKLKDRTEIICKLVIE